MILLGIIGFHEYLHLISHIDNVALDFASIVGSVVIVAMGTAGLATLSATPLFAITVFAIFIPLIMELLTVTRRRSAAYWPLMSVGSLYLGLPIYAAVALRSLPGSVDVPWISSLASFTSLEWQPTPRGMAWAMAVILIVWMSDTVAYLVGRSFGKHKLAPAISPGKTVEGALGGLLGAMLVGSAALVSFGLATWPLGLAVSAAIGGIGQIGDLCESMLKRQANAKDSGTLIPGHGGVLDRIDALLFAFPAALLVATYLEGIGA